MDTVAGLAVIALCKKILDWIRFLLNIRAPDPVERAQAINGAVTIFAGWVVSVLAVILVSNTVFAHTDIFGFSIGNQGYLGQIVIGLLAGSSTGLVVDTLNVLKRPETYSHPPLLAGLVRNAQPPDAIPATPVDIPYTGPTDSGPVYSGPPTSETSDTNAKGV